MQNNLRDIHLRRLMMKMLVLMLMFGSSLVVSTKVFSAEVGENMKSECVKIISVERSEKVDSEEIQESSESGSESTGNAQ